MKTVCIHLPRSWTKFLDDLVSIGIFPNRSEAIRVLLREGLKQEGLWSLLLETTVDQHNGERVAKSTISIEDSKTIVRGST